MVRVASNDMAGMTFSVPDALTTAAAAVAIAGSAAGVYSWCRKLYRRSIGSRKDHAKRFNELATGVTSRYIEDRFGAPAFVRDFDVRGVMKLTERLYQTRHAWLQILANENDAVVRFSITVTDPRFRFQILHLTVGQLEAKIGHSRFSEIRSFARKPKGRSFKAIVRRLGYSESYWLGSPGYYQSVVLSYNDAGTGRFGCSIDQALQRNILAFEEGDLIRDPPPGGWPECDPGSHCAQQFRAQTVVNTLTILGAGFTVPRMAELDPEGFKRARATLLGDSLGPDAEYVGTLVPAPFRQRGKPLPRPPRQ
jgi:hypothetical protein